MTDGRQVTRCPACETTFRISDTQLAAAAGSVRCGACLQVFSATDHLVTHPVEAETAADLAEVVTVPVEMRRTAAVESSEAGVPDPMDTEPIIPGDDPRDWHSLDFRVPLDAYEVADSVDGVEPLAADRWWWGLGACLLVVILFSQVVWFERAALSQNQDLRPWYEALCRLAGCELDVYRDLDALQTSGLVVRSHPSTAQALMVDAIIANKAAFRQHFPVLLLRFANMDQQLLAARSFKPADYLHGELTGLQYIPPRTEVRISLEIVDPGAEATNYSLQVR